MKKYLYFHLVNINIASKIINLNLLFYFLGLIKKLKFFYPNFLLILLLILLLLIFTINLIFFIVFNIKISEIIILLNFK